MYEIHIRHLESLFEEHAMQRAHGSRDALDAALELMRAAEPKDETAEREHLENLYAPGQEDIDMLVRERAAARAEVEAKYARLKAAAERCQAVHASMDDDEFEELRAALNELKEAQPSAAGHQ